MSHALARVSVHLLLLRGSEILLLRRANTGYEDGNYSVVAGHVEEGEQASTAMLREAKEESSIVIAPEDLEHALTMHRIDPTDQETRVDFFFTTSRWEGEPTNVEPALCDDLSWFDLHHLPSNVIPYVQSAIDGFHAGKRFLEYS